MDITMDKVRSAITIRKKKTTKKQDNSDSSRNSYSNNTLDSDQQLREENIPNNINSVRDEEIGDRHFFKSPFRAISMRKELKSSPPTTDNHSNSNSYGVSRSYSDSKQTSSNTMNAFRNFVDQFAPLSNSSNSNSYAHSDQISPTVGRSASINNTVHSTITRNSFIHPHSEAYVDTIKATQHHPLTISNSNSYDNYNQAVTGHSNDNDNHSSVTQKKASKHHPLRKFESKYLDNDLTTANNNSNSYDNSYVDKKDDSYNRSSSHSPRHGYDNSYNSDNSNDNSPRNSVSNNDDKDDSTDFFDYSHLDDDYKSNSYSHDSGHSKSTVNHDKHRSPRASNGSDTEKASRHHPLPTLAEAKETGKSSQKISDSTKLNDTDKNSIDHSTISIRKARTTDRTRTRSNSSNTNTSTSVVETPSTRSVITTRLSDTKPFMKPKKRQTIATTAITPTLSHMSNTNTNTVTNIRNNDSNSKSNILETSESISTQTPSNKKKNKSFMTGKTMRRVSSILLSGKKAPKPKEEPQDNIEFFTELVIVPFLLRILPLLSLFADFIDVFISSIKILYKKSKELWIFLKPFNLQLLLPSLIGIVMCFFGGNFVTLIAAVEAYHLFGFDQTIKSLIHLWEEFEKFLDANKQDDYLIVVPSMTINTTMIDSHTVSNSVGDSGLDSQTHEAKVTLSKEEESWIKIDEQLLQEFDLSHEKGYDDLYSYGENHNSNNNSVHSIDYNSNSYHNEFDNYEVNPLVNGKITKKYSTTITDTTITKKEVIATPIVTNSDVPKTEKLSFSPARTVLQVICNREYLTRKIYLFMKTTDPLKLTEAITCINTGFLAVIATLKLQFAKAITLGNAIAEVIEVPANVSILPLLQLALPTECKKWASPILLYTIKTIAISVAWYIQRVISAFHSAVRGGMMFSRNIVHYLKEMNYFGLYHSASNSVGNNTSNSYSEHNDSNSNSHSMDSSSGHNNKNFNNYSSCKNDDDGQDERVDENDNSYEYNNDNKNNDSEAANDNSNEETNKFWKNIVFEELLGYVVAAIGLYFQLRMRFQLPFPLNIILFPFTALEWLLMWIVNSR